MKPMHRAGLPACISTACVLAACAADDNGRKARKPPSDTRAERLVLVVDGKFHDTDANGYGDAGQVFAYVFGDLRYELPVEARGSFEFRLVRPDGSVLRSWAFDEAQAESRRARLPVGPGFQFILNLRENGTDVLEAADVELTGSFTPRGGGDRILSRVDAPISIGRVRPVGATGWKANPGR